MKGANAFPPLFLLFFENLSQAIRWIHAKSILAFDHSLSSCN